MAHILVQVERVPQGIHPASAMALCLARSTSSIRGATLVAVCSGDAGVFDKVVSREANRFGADMLLFVGPDGLATLQQRLRAVHVIVPYTADGIASGANLIGGAPVPRWLDTQTPDWSLSDPVTALVAGVLPWYDLPGVLEPEFEEDVGHVRVPGWTNQPPSSTKNRLVCVGPSDLDFNIRERLTGIGATWVDPSYASHHEVGTLVWLDAGPAGLPATLSTRAPGARVVLLPGASASVSQSWLCADWVIGGPWDQATRQLASDAWRTTLA